MLIKSQVVFCFEDSGEKFPVIRTSESEELYSVEPLELSEELEELGERRLCFLLFFDFF